MKPEVGLVLRLAGPLVEVICLMLLFASQGKGWKVGGTPVEWLLYGGFVVGFLMVAVGLVLARASATRARDEERGR